MIAFVALRPRRILSTVADLVNYKEPLKKMHVASRFRKNFVSKEIKFFSISIS